MKIENGMEIKKEDIERVIKSFYKIFPEDVAERYSIIYLDCLLGEY